MASDASKFFDEYFNQLMSGQKSGFEKEKFNIYEYLMNLGQRQGLGGAMLNASKATAPFAAEFAKNAAKAAADATSMAEQRERFEKEYAQRLAEFEEKKRQFDEQQKQENQQFTVNSQMGMFGNTGWTPQLMDALGYGGMANPGSNFTNPGATGGTGGTGSTSSSNAWYNQVYGKNHPLYNQAAAARSQAGGGGAGPSYSIK